MLGGSALDQGVLPWLISPRRQSSGRAAEDKGLPSEGMEAKANSKCHVSFFRLDGGDSPEYLSVIHVTFRIGSGVVVGAGVGVDQGPGVGAGLGVGTTTPRLRTPGFTSSRF